MRRFNWKIDTDSGEKVASANSSFTKFLGWINAMLNPNHAWFDYDEMDNKLSSMENQITQSGATGQQIALNEMQRQNVVDQASLEVEGYKKAGLNPALMYGSGTNTAPSAPAVSGQGLNMSELMSMMMLPRQMKMLDAQIKQTDAQTEKTITETEQIEQIMEYYPELTGATISELVSRGKLNISNISRNDAETAIRKVDKLIKDKENKYADRYFKARAEYEEAKDDESRASAAASMAQALMTGFEYEYARKHNAKLSSSSILAIASAVLTGLGDVADSVKQAIADVLGTDVSEYDGHDINHTAFKAFGDFGRFLAQQGRNNGGSR